VSLPESAGDDAASALAINRSMEAVIRMKPSQYLWGYHRYKNPRQLESAHG
jgi:KDO2-lipid IV(A) lauroyltransferase